MRYICLFFIFLGYPAFSQKIYENNEPFSNRMSNIISTGDFDFFGIVTNPVTLKKNQLATDFTANSTGHLNLAYGLRDNLELNAEGVIDGAIFKTQYMGFTLTNPSPKSLTAGISGHLGYDWKKEQWASSMNIGIQYSRDKFLIGGTVFANLGKNKVLDQVKVNSFNLFMSYKLRKRIYLSYWGIFPPRSKFYDYPYYSPIYFPNSNSFFVDVLFKRSKLSPGILIQYNRINIFYSKNEFNPCIRYSYLIKRK